MGSSKVAIAVFLFIVLASLVYSAETAQPVWEKNLSATIWDIRTSENYILVGAGEKVFLFDRKGNKVWDYTGYGNVTVVAIPENEGYTVSASSYVLGGQTYGTIYVIDINGTVIKSIAYQGKITGFDTGKPTQNVSNLFFPYPKKGWFLGLGNIVGGEGNPVFLYRLNPSTNQPDAVGFGASISNYTDPCARTKIFADRTVGWGGDISVGAGSKVGLLGLGSVNSHCSTGNLTIVSTSIEKTYLTTLFDFNRKEDAIVWQLTLPQKADKVSFFRNGSYAVVGSGTMLTLYDNPSVTKPKPRIVVLANSIDYALATDFFGFLGNKGIDVIHSNASDFEQYKNEKFIVILGGPDAYEGVGEIVKEVLKDDEEKYLRTKGNRKMYVKPNVWTQGQVVNVIAGSNRNETQKAHGENRADVENRAK